MTVNKIYHWTEFTPGVSLIQGSHRHVSA